MRFERLMEQLTGVFAILVLVGGTLIVIAPFATALLWGAILAYCTWRPFQRLTHIFAEKRGWSTLLVVVLILIILFGPIFYAGVAFSTHVPKIVALLQKQLAVGVPPLPDWLSSIPFIGPRLDEAWNALAARNPEIVARLRELAGPMFRAALGAGLSIMQGLGLLILSVLFAAYFYLSGETAAAGLRAGLQRVAGKRADYLLTLIGGTIRGVVYGILGTSLVQAVLCTAGYWIAGLPSPAMLGLISFFLAILPGGALVIVVPGAIWLTQHGQAGWAVFLVVWTLIVAIVVDNVLKPMLIGKTSHVPFILIILGVLGGAAVFGLLGVFVGPTLLAVTHVVIRDWAIEQREQRSEGLAAVSSAAPTR